MDDKLIQIGDDSSLLDGRNLQRERTCNHVAARQKNSVFIHKSIEILLGVFLVELCTEKWLMTNRWRILVQRIIVLAN